MPKSSVLVWEWLRGWCICVCLVSKMFCLSKTKMNCCIHTKHTQHLWEDTSTVDSLLDIWYWITENINSVCLIIFLLWVLLHLNPRLTGECGAKESSREAIYFLQDYNTHKSICLGTWFLGHIEKLLGGGQRESWRSEVTHCRQVDSVVGNQQRHKGHC